MLMDYFVLSINFELKQYTEHCRGDEEGYSLRATSSGQYVPT